ncbi:protein PLASTID REDOX INSENSITIVE 2, chloroplastic isoform X2 [Actinidia eriantha]|uniref:protein PLASTID REDOX INSENSITIVE 2, chloroplastic isoform X2 n=1 Tax=Actinidia eriantha TaxID=165200 RepID=UPI002584E63E|nr:protein PLASTID REDOX INSENSITIVE 2, chloroplastic isoform X2 [Actinidia eriantha]
MALCTSSLTSAAQVVPAKFPTSNGSILRTSWVILRHSPPTTSLPSKSLSERASPYPLRATPPQKYVYPDPIPEFAVSETQKFRDELLTKLSKEKDTFGDELEIVVDVCAEWKKLPGAAVAARASILWAQNYVDQDWEIWNSKPPN